MAQKTTIEDVARIAGVSIATVSRALGKPDVVSRDTRDKVTAAIEQTGYTANAMARNLRRQKTRMIVVLVPNIGNPFFSEILAGIEEVATANGYNILIGNTDNDPVRENNFANFVQGNQADGLLLLNGRAPDGNSGGGKLPPLVVLCERIPDSELPTVRIDNDLAAQDAIRHLIELGHRRIAQIAGPPVNILTVDRSRGAARALQAAGLDADVVVNGDFSIASGAAATRELLRRTEHPTAVFCSNDEMAMGAIQEIKAAGLTVPGDISVIGFDDLTFAEVYDPSLTTVHQPRRLIGETAMGVLVDILAGKPAPTEPIVLGAELRVRASTGPAPV